MSLSLAPSADGSKVQLLLGATIIGEFSLDGVEQGTILANAAQAQAGANAKKLLTPSLLSSVVPGMGQTWQSVIGSRADNVTYTNTTGRAIHVSVTASGTPGGIDFYVDGVSVARNTMGGATSGAWGTTCIVPAGSTYKADATGVINSWYELR